MNNNQNDMRVNWSIKSMDNDRVSRKTTWLGHHAILFFEGIYQLLKRETLNIPRHLKELDVAKYFTMNEHFKI